MIQRQAQAAIGISILAGLTGAALALLFAPRKGSETRQRMKLAGLQMQRQKEAELHDAKQQLEDSMSQARDMSSRLQSLIKTRHRQADVAESPDGIAGLKSGKESIK